MLKIKLAFILVMSFQIVLPAQVDNRKTDADIRLEDKFMTAKLQMISGKTDLALKILDSLRRDNKSNAAITFEMAKIYASQGNISLAEDFALQTVKLDANNIWYKIFYGNLMEDYGKIDEAITIYKMLLTSNPKHTDYYDKLVDLQLRNGNLVEAIAILNEKEKQLGFSESTILKKAEILNQAGKTDLAVSELNRLVLKYPNQIKYLRLIAGMHKSTGKEKEAAVYYHKILERDPTDAEANIALINKNNPKENISQYIVTLLPLIQNKDLNIDIKIKELLPLVLQHAETENSELGQSLIKACDQLVLAHPNEAKAHAIYADVLMNNGETLQAIRQFERTLELNDRNFLVWEQLMYGLAELGEFDQLVDVSLKAIDLFPNQAKAYYFAGLGSAEQGQFKKSNEYLEEASLIAGSNPYILSNIETVRAVTYLKQEKYTDALQSTEKAIAFSEGKNAKAVELAGDIYYILADKTKALNKWTEAKKLGSKSKTLSQKIENLKAN